MASNPCVALLDHALEHLDGLRGVVLFCTRGSTWGISASAGQRTLGKGPAGCIELTIERRQSALDQGAVADRRTCRFPAIWQLHVPRVDLSLLRRLWKCVHIPLFDVTMVGNTFEEIERRSGIVLCRAHLSTAGILATAFGGTLGVGSALGVELASYCKGPTMQQGALAY